MDPNATLRDAREAARIYASVGDTGMALDAADRLAQAFQTLDDWLVTGGFLPDAWKRAKR